MGSFYDFSVPMPDGSEWNMSDLKNKVVVVVNTATGCGFTPQYEDLEKLYETYKDKGLVIVDVPCNQFAGQTPGSDEEIHKFCTLKYKTQFARAAKSDVNGENALPLFSFLKQKKGFGGFGHGPKAFAMNLMLKKIDKDYQNNPDIKWNFTKFVINRNGEVAARFEPTDKISLLEDCIKGLI